MFALSLLSVLACHVFESATVNCTSDEPCARRGEDETGVDDTADTAEEIGTPIVGWVTSMTSEERGVVRVFDPETGGIEAEWKDLGEYSGAAWYNPETGNGVLVGEDAVHLLHAGGNAEYQTGGTGTARFDVTTLGSRLAVALQGGVVTVDETMENGKEIIPFGTHGEVNFVGGNSRQAFFADLTSGGPDLWLISTGEVATLVYEDYDTSVTRGANVFVGPEDKPYACSPTGGVYSVDDLAAGKVRAVSSVEGGLDDITSCAYDPGDGSWLAYSATAGVFRTSEAGETSQVHELSAGYEYARITWYGD